MMFRKIEISIQTVIFTLAILAGLWLVAQIRDILFLLFIAFLLMTAIHPLVIFLERFRLPRVVSILLVYIVVLGFLGAGIASAIPSLIAQSTRLLQALPGLVERVLPYWNIDIRTIMDQIAPISENVFKVTIGIFSNIITTLTVLVFTFYFLLERKRAQSILSELFGNRIGADAAEILRNIERRLGAWVRGQLVLMTFVGVLVYIGLTILRIEYALPLAIFAGLLEIVPIIGPNVAAIPAIIVGLATSPVLALSTAALYFVIQQIENNVLVPFIMKRSVGLSPLITILSLMVGGRLAGVIGAVLAIPLVLVLQVLVSAVWAKNTSEG